jgi:hypothetical protein
VPDAHLGKTARKRLSILELRGDHRDQPAAVAIPRGLFRAILERIRRLKVPSTVPG